MRRVVKLDETQIRALVKGIISESEHENLQEIRFKDIVGKIQDFVTPEPNWYSSVLSSLKSKLSSLASSAKWGAQEGVYFRKEVWPFAGKRLPILHMLYVNRGRKTKLPKSLAGKSGKVEYFAPPQGTRGEGETKRQDYSRGAEETDYTHYFFFAMNDIDFKRAGGGTKQFDVNIGSKKKDEEQGQDIYGVSIAHLPGPNFTFAELASKTDIEYFGSDILASVDELNSFALEVADAIIRTDRDVSDKRTKSAEEQKKSDAARANRDQFLDAIKGDLSRLDNEPDNKENMRPGTVYKKVDNFGFELKAVNKADKIYVKEYKVYFDLSDNKIKISSYDPLTMLNVLANKAAAFETEALPGDDPKKYIPSVKEVIRKALEFANSERVTTTFRESKRGKFIARSRGAGKLSLKRAFFG